MIHEERAERPFKPADNTKRDQVICKRRNEGASFDTIGAEVGLSRERVRQIVNTEIRRVARAERLKKTLAPLRAAFAKGIGPQR